jgi:hypothetical protein
MHRYKIVPPIILILSLFNFLLAAPVELPKVRRQAARVDMAPDVSEDVIPVSEKRSDELVEKLRVGWDEYPGDEPEPWPQKRGSGSESSPTAPPSVGEPAPPNSPPLPQAQTGTTRMIQNAAPDTDTLGAGSSKGGGSLVSSKSYPFWNRPELASNMGGPGSTKSLPPSGGTGSSMNQPLSSRPEVNSPGLVHWDSHDWSTSSSDSEPEPKKNFLSDTKNFFDKLIYKFKFWPRGPEAL